jgi:NTF2-related export protein 1/2
VNVTGSVLHGPHVVAGFADHASKLAARDHPRKFHEMFMLRAAEQGEGMQPKVRICKPLFR